MKTKANKEAVIKELIKPSNQNFNSPSEVLALCEPNACGVNCNVGSILGSPDEERDILF